MLPQKEKITNKDDRITNDDNRINNADKAGKDETVIERNKERSQGKNNRKKIKGSKV